MEDFSGIKFTEDGEKLLKSFEEISKTFVCVGFDENATYRDGVSVAEVAAKNEYGDSKVPPRPFMRESMNKGKDIVRKTFAKGLSEFVEKNNYPKVLEMVGEAFKDVVQDTIQNGSFKANSPVTISKKGSDKPLIDTGTMLNSVTYWVEEK